MVPSRECGSRSMLDSAQRHFSSVINESKGTSVPFDSVKHFWNIRFVFVETYWPRRGVLPGRF